MGRGTIQLHPVKRGGNVGGQKRFKPGNPRRRPGGGQGGGNGVRVLPVERRQKRPHIVNAFPDPARGRGAAFGIDAFQAV